MLAILDYHNSDAINDINFLKSITPPTTKKLERDLEEIMPTIKTKESWDIGKNSKLKAVFGHFLTLKFPTQGTNSLIF